MSWKTNSRSGNASSRPANVNWRKWAIAWKKSWKKPPPGSRTSWPRKDLARKERQLVESETFLQTRIEEQEQRLAQIAGFTAEEAKAKLFQEIEAKTRHESARMIRQIEMEAHETADRKAKEILCNVIQRYAGDYVNEQTVTAVTLPSEDMKGRIIGREGRNIRALEAATGVDLIIDDTPETVILSAYSPCVARWPR